MQTCSSITRNGSRCTSPAMEGSDICEHHKKMMRFLSLAPKKPTAKTPPKDTSALSPPPAPKSDSKPSQLTTSQTNKKPAQRNQKTPLFLHGEKNIGCSQSCTFEFFNTTEQQIDYQSYSTSGVNYNGISRGVEGVLVLTNYRVYFQPNSPPKQQLLHPLLVDAMNGVPWAAVGKIGYPQNHKNHSRSTISTTGMEPTHLLVTFLDLRVWHLRCEIHAMMLFLNSRVFVHSPVSLFAFAANPVDQRVQLAGHQIYRLTEDFNRMGVDLTRNGTFRITNVNKSYAVCPTYPRQFVVPSIMTDSEVCSVADFRSKGRMPVLCWVHGNSASIWRCAQPKRGLFNAKNQQDSDMLLYISRSNCIMPDNVWIVDCRPELNARANNFTGGGTESASIRHATVSFMNIANIHAMRESLQKIQNITSSLSTESDLNWFNRIEDTKWLYHIRLVLSAAIRTAFAVEKGQTVIVHCSDGWDRTGQICALSQLLLDPHYRTLLGLMQVIEKEWVIVGHKFNDRIGAGMVADDQQSPVFLQFLDCCWQLLRQYPTAFEFNSTALEFIADSLFSGRFGTFLGNCDRERQTLDTYNRTPSLWSYMLANPSSFKNVFYQPIEGSNEKTLLPPLPSVLRQVTLWNEYYFRFSPVQSFSYGSVNPSEENEFNHNGVISRSAFAEMNLSMKVKDRKIKILEKRNKELEDRLKQSSFNTTATVYPALNEAQKDTIVDLEKNNNIDNSTEKKTIVDQFWRCTICTQQNQLVDSKCKVCGRENLLK